MEIIDIKDEYIKLCQALKLAGFTDSGAEAKEIILNGRIKVNGEKELQRGKKLHDGDIVEYGGKKFKISAGGSV